MLGVKNGGKPPKIKQMSGDRGGFEVTLRSIEILHSIEVFEAMCNQRALVAEGDIPFCILGCESLFQRFDITFSKKRKKTESGTSLIQLKEQTGEDGRQIVRVGGRGEEMPSGPGSRHLIRDRTLCSGFCKSGYPGPGGMTPAEATLIMIRETDKWRTLIQNASLHKLKMSKFFMLGQEPLGPGA